MAISTLPPPKKGEINLLMGGKDLIICPTAKLLPPAYLIGDKESLLYANLFPFNSRSKLSFFKLNSIAFNVFILFH